MRILIAEDDDAIRELYELVLRDAGHQVISTVNGEECLKIYFQDAMAGKTFGLVLVDCGMPKKDGIEVIKEILNKCPNQRILLATAFGPESLTRLADLVKKIHVLHKPFDPDELLGVINSI